MTSQPPRPDWQQRLQQLDAEINSQAPLQTSVAPETEPQTDSESRSFAIAPIVNWFQNLPSTGKWVVGGVAVLMGLSLVSAIAQLVALSIKLAFLGGVLYLAYKIFIKPRPSNR